MAEAVVERTTTETKLLTIDEWMRRYNEQPIEVVEGKIIAMSPPNTAHVYIANDLHFSLEQYARAHQLGRSLVEAPYVLDAGDRTD